MDSLLVEDIKGKDMLNGFPITKVEVSKAKKNLPKGKNSLSSEDTKLLYEIYKKEFFLKALCDRLKARSDEAKKKIQKEYGLSDDVIRDKKKTLDEIIKGLNKSDEAEEEVNEFEEESNDVVEDDFETEDETDDIEHDDIENYDPSDDDDDFEDDDEDDEWMNTVIRMIQDNEPLTIQTKTSVYPDVEDETDTEVEPPAPVIPIFPKPSFKEGDGVVAGKTRADNQWIESKMLLLRKRGVI